MKKRIIRHMLILLLAAGIFNIPVKAQEGEPSTSSITARVIDEEGLPVPNIFVMSFVTHDKVLTDADGNFTLHVSATTSDQLVIDEKGYEIAVVDIFGGQAPEEPIQIIAEKLIDGGNDILLPYQAFDNSRNVSSTYTISGEELASYPSVSFLEALSGRIPGLLIHVSESAPGHEEVSAYIRGVEASIYINGIRREATDLSVYEVDKVQVIKDLSGRAALGISGVNPVIWITTKSGDSYNTQINVSAEYGMSSPTVLPEYLRSFQYATLYNEALVNDGMDPLYDQTALNAYRDGTDPLYYPDIDYFGNYVKSTTPFRKANINFGGGDKNVNYFSMLDYVGSDGLEAVGEQTKTDRFKMRGNVNIRLNDFIRMSVSISGTYGKSRYPNWGSGADLFNMFDILSTYPSNAHGMSYMDTILLISDDYGINLDNELMYSGYALAVDLNSQNTATLMIDLNKVLEGLTFSGTASFDIYSNITTNKGGTAALYRVLPNYEFDRIQEEVIEPSLYAGNDDFLRRTVGYLQFNYNRVFGDHALSMHAAYFQGLVGMRTTTPSYQPAKMQDLSYRANYAFKNKYTLQLDLAYSGSMKMPAGERFSLYPTVGAAWVVSNESFLNNSNAIDFLKVYASLGVMGNENFTLEGYNPYYLYKTLWYDGGDWQSGIQGDKGDVANVYYIQQAGSDNYSLPRRSYLNIGTQGDLFNRALSLELNYFYQKDYDLISQKSGYTPSIYGTGGFLPATNFGETNRWGIDAMVEHSKSIGEFSYSVGTSVMYTKGKYVVVDEPVAEEEYRKLAGKEWDLFWVYEDEGLFQNQGEIDSRNVTQSWGELKPGDIRYMDYNGDDVVNEKDIHTTGVHAPRLFYNVHLSVSYRGIGLFLLGLGEANGDIMLTNPRYFWVNGNTQNYSEPMLERFPESNDYPRLTTHSQNNYQPSTFWMANAAYFSLKNVEVSYTLPKNVSQRILLRNCKIFARGTNLLSLSGLNQYKLDPENIWAGTYVYPIYRTITFGISCKF